MQNDSTSFQNTTEESPKCDQHISATLYKSDVEKLNQITEWFDGGKSDLLRRIIRTLHAEGPQSVERLKKSIS